MTLTSTEISVYANSYVERIKPAGYLPAAVARADSFAVRLRRERLKAGFQRSKDLATALGVSPGVVSRWETGKAPRPNLRTLQNLSRALKCDVADLIPGGPTGDDKPSLITPRMASQIETILMNDELRDWFTSTIAKFSADKRSDEVDQDTPGPRTDSEEKAPESSEEGQRLRRRR